MRSLATQTVDELGGSRSVLARQKADHVRLDTLLERLERSSGNGEAEVLEEINRLVFPHAFAEEAVLWPAIRRLLPDGDEITLQIEAEHQEVNELVTALEENGEGDPERPARLARLVEVLRDDVRDEEDTLLPRLQERLERDELVRLGWAWEAARRIAPTRPHPTVSRRPPGNVLSAAPLSMIDRTRDRLDRKARKGSATARAASGRLARMSAAVERARAARSGDRPPTAR